MPTPVVRLSDVRVTYRNGTRALDVSDLVVESGERLALVGPSGAGKSTLLKLLTGRVAIDGARVDGRVEVFGLDARRLRGRARRRHANRVGTVGQDHDLVGPLLVVHNVNAGRLGTWSTWRALRSLVHPVDRRGTGDILGLVGLDPALLEVRVDELSGGQRQRVAVARMLCQRPELVLADEPVASLDPGLSELVLDLLAHPPAGVGPRAGWTSVVSLHQPELARRFAERVVGIGNGTIAFDVAAGDLTDDLLGHVYGRR